MPQAQSAHLIGFTRNMAAASAHTRGPLARALLRLPNAFAEKPQGAAGGHPARFL